MNQVSMDTFIPGETYISVMNFDKYKWHTRENLSETTNIMIDRAHQYQHCAVPILKATFLRYYTSELGSLMAEWYNCKAYIPKDIYLKKSLYPLDIYESSLLHVHAPNGLKNHRLSSIQSMNRIYFKQSRFEQKDKHELQTQAMLRTRRQLQRALTGTVVCKDGIHSLYLPHDIIRLITTVYIDYSV